ncbi:hypothetical protein GCM10007978_05380 [Shewanella hanedai]|nr:hypothetical protein GCM10007978_05380 [Shewanella hanedai]
MENMEMRDLFSLDVLGFEQFVYIFQYNVLSHIQDSGSGFYIISKDEMLIFSS